jgi:hypothetical protein
MIGPVTARLHPVIDRFMNALFPAVVRMTALLPGRYWQIA